MKRWGEMMERKNSTTDHRAFIEPTVESKRRKQKTQKKISGIDILNIAYRVLIEKEY